MATKVQANLTEEQVQALSAHDRSVSLAAGAGCGKTFVLTERFLSYLDPRQIEPTAELTELVAITFTDAAAREMRDRIRRRCYERLQAAADPAQRGAWKQLLSTLDGARISTIHAFCATLLRNHAAEAAVDPQFEVLDAPAAELLRLQALDDHLRQLLLAHDPRLIELATHFGLRDLRDYTAGLLGGNVRAVVERWQHATAEQLVTHWQDDYQTRHVPAAVARLLDSAPVQRLQELCTTSTVSSEKFQRQAQSILDVLNNLEASETPQLLVQQLAKLARVQGVCTAKDFDDPADFEEFKGTCTAVRDQTKQSILNATFAADPLHEAAKIGLDLLQLVAAVTDRYDLAKSRRNALEFDDLLAKTHALLTDSRFPHVQQNIARSTKLLMVDEFQDTDPLQVAIVKTLCGDDWSQQGLFVVGDFKQSIYRFRGAEPRVSSELRETLPEESRLSLTTNFRSQPAILDFVNALFHDAFTGGDSFANTATAPAGDPPVNRYEPLVAHRPQETPTPAIEFLWSSPEANPSNPPSQRRRGDAARGRMQEARYIARRLAQLLDDGAPMIADRDADGETQMRALALGDIAILLRALSDVALYEAALREYGLDYYLAGGHAFYAQQEIHDVLHLLRSIASPLDELSLAGVLRSPIFALADESLFWLHEAAGSLNGGLLGETLPEELSPAENAKVQRAATILGQLREQKDQLLVSELLNEAISATGYDAMLLTEFLGHRKWANVQKLVDQARTLDRTRPGDLHGFVTQLSEFVVRAPKEPLAATQSEGDVIRIMTIHQAKGLEFPLVVVPDLDRQNNRVSHGPVFDPELGPLVKSKAAQTVVGWNLYHFAEKEHEREERKRLLYVACTRAADYLLLSSSLDDLDKPTSDWMQMLADHFELTTGHCRTELPAG
ncbi:MAG: UvrD-helicase domain-containing protein, partial [Bythopirellula sp.]